MIEARPGFLFCRVHGENADRWFRGEAGGHRWQRVPPTEKRGRVHSSTITVAVLDPTEVIDVDLDPADLEEVFTRGSGAGGQHRNKTSTAVILSHRPSGTQVRVDGGRSQWQNRLTAIALLRSRLLAEQETAAQQSRGRERRMQTGSGMRGDKIRTVQVQGDVVVDHRRGTRTTYRRYLRGHLEDLIGDAS